VIGRGSVVGANSLVCRSVPAHSVVAGNPARLVKQYDPLKKMWVLGSCGVEPEHREYHAEPR
jgi:acetyltransferase-like isoleucine patch superfamily enzyme